MGILFFLLILICLAYSFHIWRFVAGWLRMPVFSALAHPPAVKVSLIIPFRNEEKILAGSIPEVLNLEYPGSLLEVIYVNDHSEDTSANIVSSLIRTRDNFHLLHLGHEERGKKAAIARGASFAGGDLLLFTDADCFPSKAWVRTMALFYEKYSPVLISGPVLIRSSGKIFSQLQALEHLSLMGSGAGSFGAGSPILCSAANLGFSRVQYLRLCKYLNQNVASGDDIFMMLLMKNLFPGKLLFVKSLKAVVFTEMPATFRSFLDQRIRWASKARYYRDFHILYTALLVFFINLALLLLFFYGLMKIEHLWIWASLVAVKSIPDFTLMFMTARFFHQDKLLRWFIPVQLIYPLYTFISGIGGLLVRPVWKNRR